MKTLSTVSHKNPLVGNIRPLATMPQEWWQLMAIIYDLAERQRIQPNLSIIKRETHRSEGSIRHSLDRMADAGLIDTDSDTPTGWRKFYYLTDAGYELLEQFNRAVNSQEQAEQFYSSRFLPSNGFDRVGVAA